MHGRIDGRVDHPLIVRTEISVSDGPITHATLDRLDWLERCELGGAERGVVVCSAPAIVILHAKYPSGVGCCGIVHLHPEVLRARVKEG